MTPRALTLRSVHPTVASNGRNRRGSTSGAACAAASRPRSSYSMSFHGRKSASSIDLVWQSICRSLCPPSCALLSAMAPTAGRVASPQKLPMRARCPGRSACSSSYTGARGSAAAKSSASTAPDASRRRRAQSSRGIGRRPCSARTARAAACQRPPTRGSRSSARPRSGPRPRTLAAAGALCARSARGRTSAPARAHRTTRASNWTAAGSRRPGGCSTTGPSRAARAGW